MGSSRVGAHDLLTLRPAPICHTARAICLKVARATVCNWSACRVIKLGRRSAAAPFPGAALSRLLVRVSREFAPSAPQPPLPLRTPQLAAQIQRRRKAASAAPKSERRRPARAASLSAPIAPPADSGAEGAAPSGETIALLPRCAARAPGAASFQAPRDNKSGSRR